MNSNRFISRLMDQNLIRIIKISTLTFMPSNGTLTWFFITLFGFCRKFVNMDVIFLWIFTEVLWVVFIRFWKSNFFLHSLLFPYSAEPSRSMKNVIYTPGCEFDGKALIKRICRYNNGHLVTITDEKKLHIVLSEIQRLPTALKDSSFWIGPFLRWEIILYLTYDLIFVRCNKVRST